MNWLDLLIIVCVAIGLIKGLFDGIIKQVISLLSLILAIFFAGAVANPIREFLLKQSFVTNTFPNYIITGVCYILAFSVIILAFYWLGKLLETAIKVTPAKGLNHFLGGLLGALKWVFILSLAFSLLIILDPRCKLLPKQTRQESVLFYKISCIVPVLYPYVKNYLDIEKVITPAKEKKKELPSDKGTIQV